MRPFLLFMVFAASKLCALLIGTTHAFVSQQRRATKRAIIYRKNEKGRRQSRLISQNYRFFALSSPTRRRKIKERFSSITTKAAASSSSSSSFSSQSWHLFQTPQRVLVDGQGYPSSPGWQTGRLERLTEWTENKAANRPVMCEYHPSAKWLWTKWTGTIFKMTWKDVLLSMALTLMVHLYMTNISMMSPQTLSKLLSLKKIWEHQLTLTTFILTFFTSQAFSYWQKVYQITRMIQGRINDICMLVVVGAKRGRGRNNENTNQDHQNNVNNFVNGFAGSNSSSFVQSSSADNDNGENNRRCLDNDAESMVLNATRLLRMSHIFFWAATPTASNGLNDCEQFIKDSQNCSLPFDDLHIGPILLSTYGLRALMESGQLTQQEIRDLMTSKLPPSQYAYVLLVWASLHITQGFDDGTIRQSPGLEETIFRHVTSLRASMFDIDDMRAGRMPLAYVHLIQILVDTLVLVSPFALYPDVGGLLSVPLVGLITLFYRGLLKISKSFLDPFGVEGFDEQNIRVDVLVSEINFGAGQRWYNAAKRFPQQQQQQQQQSTSSEFKSSSPSSAAAS